MQCRRTLSGNRKIGQKIQGTSQHNKKRLQVLLRRAAATIDIPWTVSVSRFISSIRKYITVLQARNPLDAPLWREVGLPEPLLARHSVFVVFEQRWEGDNCWTQIHATRIIQCCCPTCERQ
jgi:hypothetical protein